MQWLESRCLFPQSRWKGEMLLWGVRGRLGRRLQSSGAKEMQPSSLTPGSPSPVTPWLSTQPDAAMLGSTRVLPATPSAPKPQNGASLSTVSLQWSRQVAAAYSLPTIHCMPTSELQTDCRTFIDRHVVASYLYPDRPSDHSGMLKCEVIFCHHFLWPQ